jgi:hypothetical protein
VLADHFHLIAGTSTAILAALLSWGEPVARLRELYVTMAARFSARRSLATIAPAFATRIQNCCGSVSEEDGTQPTRHQALAHPVCSSCAMRAPVLHGPHQQSRG